MKFFEQEEVMDVYSFGEARSCAMKSGMIISSLRGTIVDNKEEKDPCSLIPGVLEVNDLVLLEIALIILLLYIRMVGPLTTIVNV